MQSFIVSIREEAYGRSRLYVVCDKACIMYIIHTSMGCGVQEGRRAHITLHSLIGRLLRRAALRPGRWRSLPSLLPAAAAAAALRLLCTVPSQDTRFMIRIQMTSHLVSIRWATTTSTRFADETAPVWSRTSTICCGLHLCLPRVMGCGCRVVDGCLFSSHQSMGDKLTSIHVVEQYNRDLNQNEFVILPPRASP